MHAMDFDYEEPIEKRFEELCQDLCIEGAIREEAWEKYKDVWANYSIDGDQLQWLVCSLYECCRRSISDSLSGHIVDNAYISLSRLLATAKMSMVQFFHRVKRWADMTDMADDMRDRIDLIERQFAVSSVIFRNFGRSFGVLFHESGYNKQMHPTGTDLFRFTWLLFIKSRATFPAVTDDLVNSYHLLTCCLDWVLGSVMLARRGAAAANLINLDFGGYPKDFILAVSLKQPWCPQVLPGNHQHRPYDNNAPTPPCMLRPICEDNDINYVECKTVKEHFFRPFIVRLLEKELIKVHLSSVGSLLEPENFDITLQNLNNNYEEYIISTGDFDERIYLSANAAEEIGSTGESGVQSSALRLPSELAPSARRYMLELSNSGFGGFTETNRRGNANAGAICRLNGGVNFNNPEARNQNLNQLQLLLSGRLPEPSAALIELTEAHCQPSPLPDVRQQVEEFSLEFQRAYTGLVDPEVGGIPGESTGSNLAVPAAQQRLQLGCTFFFMALEQILVDELGKLERRLPATTGGARKFDISVLLSHQLFLRSLFACCMELVLLSCDPPDRHFPWVLTALTLDALQFFKVIEVVIRNVDFPRDVVKYMRQVTELILDSYAWRSNSPLWPVIKASGRAPTIEEVIPPEKLDQTSGSAGNHYASRAGDLRRLATSGVTPGISGVVSIKPSSSPPTAAKQARLLTIAGMRSLAMLSKSRAPIGQLVDDESEAATAHLLASDLDPLPEPVSAAAAASLPVGERAPEEVEPDAQEEMAVDVHMPSATGASGKGVRSAAPTPLVSSGGAEYDDIADVTEELGPTGSCGAAPKWAFDETAGANTRQLSHYPIRHDSIAIFFRQVYRVASLRLRQLCDRLNLGRDVLAKVWTCFEHAVVHETDALLRDRCIDQVLLCCLYGVCKVAHYRPISFIDVIHVYRMQPQSNREIYRRVLINSDTIYGGSANSGEYGDLSRFYNVIFLPQMKDFIKKAAAVGHPDSIDRPSVLTGSLSNPILPSATTIPVNATGLARSGDPLWSDGAPAPTLAPIPVFAATTMSAPTTASVAAGLSTSTIPSGHIFVSSSGVYGSSTVVTDVSQARRIATNRNVFISPAKQQVNLSPKRVVFTVGRSTGKDLQHVNLMINSAEKRASVANLTSISGMNRPVTHTPGIISPATATYTVSTNRGVIGAGPRTITLLGGPRKIDFDM